MMWVAYSAMWLVIGYAVTIAVSEIGSAMPLWFLIVPLFVSLKESPKKPPNKPVRTCHVTGAAGGQHKAIFHQWIQKTEYVNDKPVQNLYGIVELENGRIVEYESHLIRFDADKNLLSDADFGEWM